MKSRNRRRIAWIASSAAHLLLLVGFWQFGEERAHRIPDEVPTVEDKSEIPMVLAFAEEREEPVSIEVKIPDPVKPAVMAEVKPAKIEVVDVVGDLKRVSYEETQPPMAVPMRPAEYPAVPPMPPRFASGKVLHGALPAGRRAVYMLDRSLSMGLVRDTFEAARAALYATASGTPAGGSFQVLVYNSDVVTLLGGPRNTWLKMDGELSAKLRKSLAALEPEGRSRHDVALRAALAQEADYIIWTTDADDAELLALKPILKSARKPMAVYLCRAGGGKIAAPVEWK